MWHPALCTMVLFAYFFFFSVSPTQQHVFPVTALLFPFWPSLLTAPAPCCLAVLFSGFSAMETLLVFVVDRADGFVGKALTTLTTSCSLLLWDNR